MFFFRTTARVGICLPPFIESHIFYGGGMVGKCQNPIIASYVFNKKRGVAYVGLPYDISCFLLRRR
jgi:hypothetical protein